MTNLPPQLAALDAANAEIERLREHLGLIKGGSTSCYDMMLNAEKERDRYRAENARLISANAELLKESEVDIFNWEKDCELRDRYRTALENIEAYTRASDVWTLYNLRSLVRHAHKVSREALEGK